jgi:TPR repeat protein
MKDVKNERDENRRGRGCTPDAARALHLSALAARNATPVETPAHSLSRLPPALRRGRPGRARASVVRDGHSDCFRHGWGVPHGTQDADAAKQYFEAAANLGDGDALNKEVRCYEEGFGTPK